MEITIRLVGYLAHSSEGKTLRGGQVLLPDASALEDALVYAGVPMNAPLMITVNGTFAQRGQTLKDGDIVSLIPPIGGG